ncbi:MAG: insulinase family protein, partial [Gammaproteobacteria bacterium]|nr:insulinase family protein [Gammaproteobacteria bacterium]
LEADRMQHLLLDEKEFAKELRVVMEERRMRTDDQPEALAYERFMNTAYAVHNYRNPIIGWMRDLEKLTAGDLRAWYRRWYVPNNATLVVVGDVKTSEVVALARRTFGVIPKRELVRTAVPPEPVQTKPRRSQIKAPAQVPTLFLGYHVPALSMRPDDWEPYALIILSGVLDGGVSSRFESRLVRGQEIAAGIGTGYSPTARHPVLFTISATPSEKKSVEQVEAAIRGEIRNVQEAPVGAEELDRVKAQVAARDVFARDSSFYQAMQMGMLETVGLDAHLLPGHIERLRAVTAAQVQQVAKKYLTESNLTVTVLDPEPGKLKPRVPGPKGDSHVR